MVEEVKANSEPIENIKESSRTTELVLGIIGGIFGLLGGIAAVIIGTFFDAFGATGSSDIIITGSIAIIVSIIGIIGAILARNKPKLGGILMIVSGIIGFICIFVFYILGGIFLVIGGILALVRK